MIDTSRPVEPGNCWTRLLACNMLDPLLSRTFTPHSIIRSEETTVGSYQ